MADLLFPPGYGLRRPSLPELRERQSLFGGLQIFEPPRKKGGHRYVLGVDVADGLGLDRSVICVLRLGTMEEPEEEVAQFLDDAISPSDLAAMVDAIGHYYADPDGIEALAAIETNNHGLSTQDMLQHHLGYTNFYRWEYYDAADPSARFSRRIGWMTTTRTRPFLMDKFVSAITTLDPVTGLPDLILRSRFTIDELADLATEGELGEAAASANAHDDCIMAVAIAHYVAYRLAAGEREPLAERRHRYLEQQAARQRAGDPHGRRDYRNTDITAEELALGISDDALDEADPSAPTFSPFGG